MSMPRDEFEALQTDSGPFNSNSTVRISGFIEETPGIGAWKIHTRSTSVARAERDRQGMIGNRHHKRKAARECAEAAIVRHAPAHLVLFILLTAIALAVQI